MRKMLKKALAFPTHVLKRSTISTPAPCTSFLYGRNPLRKRHIVFLRMKLNALLLLLAFTQVNANTIAQEITLEGKNMPLEQVIGAIKKQTGFGVVYSKELLQKAKPLSFSARNMKLPEFLDLIFRNQPIKYKIEEKNIFLTYDQSLVLQQQPAASHIQPLTRVRIKVTDSSGRALPGATVGVQGKQLSVAADNAGHAFLDLNAGDVIRISYVGYETVIVKINRNHITNQEVKVILKLNLNNQVSMKDVVVIGYGSLQKKDLTGSVGQVNTEDIEKAPVYTIEQSLAGRVAGLNVYSNQGQPGEEGTNVRIRGVGSITQDASPLYVIDGFATENFDLASLNPEDIESINVLKDASATAIYGARGANGVIVIETKKGRPGKAVLNYSGSLGFQSVVKKIDVMDPYEFVKLEFERDPVVAEQRYLRGAHTLEDYKNVKGISWQDQFFRTGNTNIHNISLRGGNAQTRYSVSGSLYNTDAIVVNTGLKKQQGRVSIDHTVNSKVTAGVNIDYSHIRSFGQITAKIDDGYASSALMYSVWGYRPVTIDFFNDEFDLNEFTEEIFDDAITSTTDYRINPVQSAKNTYRNRDINIMRSNAYVTYKITKDLTFKSTGSIYLSNRQLGQFYNSGTREGSPLNTRNTYGQWGSMNFDKSYTWSNENTLTYTRKTGKSKMTLMGGMTLQEASAEGNNYTAIKVPNESLGISALGSGTPLRVNSSASYNTLNSYFVRGDFNYNSRYLFTATFRADGSSKFPQNKWGYFPSGAFAWRMSEEAFFPKTTVIDDAKLRISYGVTGNNRIGDFSALSPISINNSTSYSFGNETPSPVAVPGIGNPGLRWETNAQLDIGYDLSLFNRRVNIVVDYYQRKTTDLLLRANMPPTTGYATAYKNIGSLRNEGFEFTLNTTNVSGKDFKWTSEFNISFNRNTVLKLADGEVKLLNRITPRWQSGYAEAILYGTTVGQSIGNFVGYIFEGLYQLEDFDKTPSGGYVLKKDRPTVGTNVKPGYAKYRDLNNDGVIDGADQTVIGRGLPVHTGGFSNNFTYKNFSLNIFFQWSYGNQIYNANQLIFEGSTYSGLNQWASFANRWTPENTSSNIPVMGGVPQGYYSTRELSDGSYLRFKTVSLAYTLPKNLVKKAGFSGVSLVASAQNLFTITNYSGIDPEVSTYHSNLTPGFDYSAYPTSRTIVFGIKASL
jgi:TonB-linked outer membrane protein, SusC/RagA family